MRSHEKFLLPVDKSLSMCIKLFEVVKQIFYSKGTVIEKLNCLNAEIND